MAEIVAKMKVEIENIDEVQAVLDLCSSRLLSMAEAALDMAAPHWRGHVPQIRQVMKDNMIVALHNAAIKNHVAKRNSMALTPREED